MIDDFKERKPTQKGRIRIKEVSNAQSYGMNVLLQVEDDCLMPPHLCPLPIACKRKWRSRPLAAPHFLSPCATTITGTTTLELLSCSSSTSLLYTPAATTATTKATTAWFHSSVIPLLTLLTIVMSIVSPTYLFDPSGATAAFVLPQQQTRSTLSTTTGVLLASAQGFPFAKISTSTILVNTSSILVHYNVGALGGSGSGGSDNNNAGAPSTPASAFVAITSPPQSSCLFFATPALPHSQYYPCANQAGNFLFESPQDEVEQQPSSLPQKTLRRPTEIELQQHTTNLFAESLTSGSVVRLGDGSVLLNVDTATSSGGTGATYVINNILWGTLIRVRGLSPVAGSSSSTNNNNDVRYFLLGGTSTQVEELVDSSSSTSTGTAEDVTPPYSHLKWTNGNILPATCIASQAGVVHAAQFLPFSVLGCHYLTPTNPTGFYIIEMDAHLGPMDATVYGNAIGPISAVVVRESYVFLVTTNVLQVVVLQFGSNATTTEGQQTQLTSHPNQWLTAYVYTPVSTSHDILTNCFNTPNNAGSAFIDPDTSNFFVGCGAANYMVFAALAVIPAVVSSASIVYPNPFRDNSLAPNTIVQVRVSYQGFTSASLMMFSEFDDCSVFVKDGPFPLTDGTDQKTFQLSHTRPGTQLFLCASLGYCPITQPSSTDATCTAGVAAQDCVAQGGCAYTTGGDIQSTVTCCTRQAFPNLVASSGIPPSGSYWMLVKASPLRILTATAVQSLSHSTSITKTITVTKSRLTITATVTTSADSRSPSPTKSPTVTSTARPSNKTVTPSIGTASLSWSAAVTDTVTRHRNSSTPSLSRSHASRTASVTKSGGSVTSTVTLTASDATRSTLTISVKHNSTTKVHSRSHSPTATLSHATKTMSHSTTPSFSAEVLPSKGNKNLMIALIAGGSSLLLILVAIAVVWKLRRLRRDHNVDATGVDGGDLATGLGGAPVRREALRSFNQGQGTNERSSPTYSNQATEFNALNVQQSVNETTPIASTTDLTSGAGGKYATLINSTKYTISKLLGKGGYGMVFLAFRGNDPNKKAALKYITCRTDYDRQLAVREFEVIVKVKHPNIIPIWDVFLNWQSHVDFTAYGQGTTSSSKKGKVSGARSEELVSGPPIPGFHGDQTPFQQGDSASTALTRPRYVAIVTKYYPEGDLKRYCYVEKKQGRQIPEERILSYMLQITTLIVKLHDEEQQIVHRDLKPENILLDENCKKVIVTDFGLAFNNVNEATHMTTQAGSLPFVAPECWSKYYNAKVDVWSLGCMLYALCTQRVTGDDSRVMFNDVDEPWFEEELKREVVQQGLYSTELFDIMMKMLVKNPLKRLSAFQTEGELAALMRSRNYSMEYVTLTPAERPQRAIEREREDERKRADADAKAAEEAAVRRAQREKRKLERQQLQQQQQPPAAASSREQPPQPRRRESPS
ncbi:protein kinase, putative [Bodo saltans]|uniref:non-specific serine/threonine protein kinase n=1 Tax=Bodo saltans TaxID=75058 RepID=A0A0S4JC18_BODSA|nr:protein kinase, putative [Bodo saltans]|eukprot:CUG87668.1 protein kinase, putative [Bodo saltans]